MRKAGPRLALPALLAVAMGCAGGCMQASAQGMNETPAQHALFDSFQMCATMQLPEDFRAIRDPLASARSAADACHQESLALAGQFALANPGSRQTDEFMKLQHKRVVDTLSQWIVASTKGATPHPGAAAGRMPSP